MGDTLFQQAGPSLSPETTLSRPRTGSTSQEGTASTHEQFGNDEVQWQFQPTYADAQAPSVPFSQLSQTNTLLSWPQQPPQQNAANSSVGNRPLTAPALSPHDYQQFLTASSRDASSHSQASGFLSHATGPNHFASVEALGYGRPRPGQQHSNSLGFGADHLGNNNSAAAWDHRARMFSQPEATTSSFGDMMSHGLPDEPRAAGSHQRNGFQNRPATSGAALPSSSLSYPPLHHNHIFGHQSNPPVGMAHPIYGGPTARPYAFPGQPPNSASAASQHYPFSHDPFPIASPSASRPNTAGGRLTSLPSNSNGLLSQSAMTEHHASASGRPSTATSLRPDTATSFSSTTTASTATLGDLSSQIAEPGQTATAIGADGRVYQFVGVATQQRKRARRRFDEIERMYDCSYPGCTKSYGCLNHLNAHVAAQKHGAKRLPAEFKEMRKEWRARKRMAEAAARKNADGAADDAATSLQKSDEMDGIDDDLDDSPTSIRPRTAGSISQNSHFLREQQASLPQLPHSAFDFGRSYQSQTGESDAPLFGHSVPLARQNSDPFDYRPDALDFRPQTAPQMFGSHPTDFRPHASGVFAFTAPPLNEGGLSHVTSPPFLQQRLHTSPAMTSAVDMLARSHPPPSFGTADPSKSPTSPFRNQAAATGDVGYLGLPNRRRGSLPLAQSLNGIPEVGGIDDWDDREDDMSVGFPFAKEGLERSEPLA